MEKSTQHDVSIGGSDINTRPFLQDITLIERSVSTLQTLPQEETEPSPRKLEMIWPPYKPSDMNGSRRYECEKHPGNDLMAGCETCDDALVCSKCMVTTCYGHKLITFEEVVEREKVRLEESINKAETEYLPNLKVKMELIQTRRQDLKTHFYETRKTIRKTVEQLKIELDKYAEQLLSEVDEFEARKDEIMKTSEENIKREEREITECLENFRTILQSQSIHLDNAVELKEMTRLLAKPTSAPSFVPVIAVMWFVPREVSPSDIEEILGSFQRSTLVSEFQTMQERIRSIQPMDDMAWVTCQGKKETCLVHSSGAVKRTLLASSYLLNLVTDASPGNDGSVWITRCDGIVTQVTESRKFDRFFIGNHAIIYSLFVFNDDDIILGIVEGVISLKGKVVKYNEHGKEHDKAVWDDDGKLLFNTPDKVRGCRISGDIAVVNRNPRGSDSVIVLDSDMRFKFRFSGPEEFHTNGYHIRALIKFLPTDVCYDAGQNLLITDRGSRSVMMLDSHGGLFRKLMTDESSPSGIGIQNNGHLWIGYNTGKIKIFKYYP